MDRNPKQPKTWPTKQLLLYCTQNDIPVLRGMEKDDLIQIVNAHLKSRRSRDQARAAMKPKEERVDDLLNTSPEVLLRHAPYASYTDTLRKNPHKLRELIEAGVQQLASVEFVHELFEAGLPPPVVGWLRGVVEGDDGGAALREVLTPPPTTAVCGRYFRDHEMVAHCRDCAVDSTCVMCMDCFLDSPCRSHNYTLHAGSVGGMCDCGDAAAWKARNFCPKHLGFGGGGWVPAPHEPWWEGVLWGLLQLSVAGLQQLMAMMIGGGREGGSPRPGWDPFNRTERPEEETHEITTEGFDSSASSDEEDEGEGRGVAGEQASEAARWVWGWLGPLAGQLKELSGCDWARRLLSTLWAEPTMIASAHLSAGAVEDRNASCLEMVFFFQLNADAKDRRSEAWSSLVRSIAKCLSDPTFRVPFAALFMTYAERLQCKKYHLNNLFVQVFSCPVTLSTLTRSLELMPYAPPHFDSIVHRQLSAIIYCFCQIPSSSSSALGWRWVWDGGPSWVIFVNERSNRTSVSCTTALYHLINRNDDMSRVAVLSRTFIRAWLHQLVLLSINAVIRKDPMSFTDMHSITEWISLLLVKTMWAMMVGVDTLLSSIQPPPQELLTSTTAPNEMVPIVSDVAWRLINGSRRFDPIPDRAAQCKNHRCILQRAALEDGEEASLLSALPSSPDEAPTVALSYIVALLQEVKMVLDVFLLAQRDYFRGGRRKVVLQREVCSILAYDLLEPVGDMMTLVLPVQRFMAMLIRSWLTHQQALYAKESITDSVALLVARRLYGCDNRQGWRPLRTLMDKLLSSTTQASSSAQGSSLEFLGELLDSLVMPFVLISQREEGLWRRNDCNALARIQRYLELPSNYTILNDIYLIQVLATCLPPQELSIHLLQRFSYGHNGGGNPSQKEEVDEKTSPKNEDLGVGGLAGYLRLMITLIQDSSKANNIDRDSTQELRRLIALQLSKDRLAHSRLVSYAGESFFGRFPDNSNSLMKCLSQAMGEIVVSEDGPSGKIFRLKDLRTWERWVSLYHPMCRDADLPSMVSQYRRIASVEKALRSKSACEEEGEREGRTTHDASPQASLPPSRLREDEQDAELIPSLRALLHTDGLLLPACYVVQLYVFNLRHPDEADPGLPGEIDPDEGERPHIGEHLLLHAITVLYLCVGDCAVLSRALRAEAGVDDGPDAVAVEEERRREEGGGCHEASPFPYGSDPLMRSDSDSDGIAWEYVEAYLARTLAATPTAFTAESIHRYVRLPELTGAPSIRVKLATPVPPHRLRRTPGVDGAGRMGRDGIPTADALHELREHLRKTPQLDEFGLLTMVESILLATGLARFPPPRGPSPGDADPPVKSRQQQVKERQEKLLRRLQNRSSKVCVTMGLEGEAAVQEGRRGDAAEASPPPILAPTPASGGYLHSKLLVESATLECCVCRLTHHEPVLLLGLCSTSGVLRHLRSAVLPDRRQVHGHYYTCGHAIHKSCTNRIFRRLAQLWQRGHFQGQNFLGASEFSCPICLMVCTNLSPLPVFSGSPGREGAQDERTLFEDIQRSTVSLNEPEMLSAVGDLHTSLAQAAIGASTAMDAKPIETYEDPLQRCQNDAWILSETLRTIYYSFRITLETIKAGVHELNQKDLLTFLSLLISIPSQSLAKHYTALQTNYSRTGHDAFCLLILEVLKAPKEASSRIQKYTENFIATHPQAREIARNILRTPARDGAEVGGIADEENTHNSSAQPPAHDPVVLWMDLGCLVLLKLMVCDEPAGAVLDAREENAFSIPPMHTRALETMADRGEAILRMWWYLTRVDLGSDRNPIPAAAARFAAATIANADEPFSNEWAPARFVNPGQWREHLLDEVLHLPIDYIDLVVRHNHIVRTEGNEDRNREQNILFCCLCGKFLCIEHRGKFVEPFCHARECVGGVGVFLILHYSSLLILDAVAGRLAEYNSIYTDKFGEVDKGLRRGVHLTRNAELCKRFLKLWIRNEWSAHSMILRNSRRITNMLS
ncbi:unnamed protein product [Phytomonas sp. EM1]|nr:unnamed protein product [Phytomonas sp. EM1]|eukprot:CCW65290.1 unnamed protein product [Phytomonas sp. isolate EM1]